MPRHAAMLDIDTLPAAAGAYALLIRLPASWIADIPHLCGRVLGPGRYVYCGSAWGPGGLGARVTRHLRTRKPVRWHVDRLTRAGRIEGAAVRVGGRECDLVDALAAAGATVPLAGFGSSDCRHCRAHLVAVPDDLGLIGLSRIIGLGPDAVLSL
ncbi:MAG: GIY-YIG nuclease family protein [Rhodospirillales bacterium]|nr:MAG: GIY-YIG nuclease family protein [Rhodospirillales bacterium]